NPKCDRLSENARKMAVHAVNILENAQIVDSLPAALVGCQRAIATTVRSRSVPIKLEPAPKVLPWLLTPDMQSALLFGAEERGLSNDELKYAQKFVCIPSHPTYPSLNLAQAVAICAYELYQAWLTMNNSPQATVLSPSQIVEESIATSAPIEVLESYYQDLEAMLLEIGFLHSHTASVKMEKFRRLYNKANLQPEEVAMLRGILRQIRWAMNN
ncbi:MAG: RNA methyltransferase, partial [Waterburya sp.]